MYKNTEKQLAFLLDKAMDNLDSLDDKLNYYGNAGYRFKELFYKNNGILTTEMQKKIIDILEIQHAYHCWRCFKIRNIKLWVKT